MAAAGGTGANWMGVSWSLAVEEQFYLVLPLAVYLLPKRPLVWVLATGVVVAPVLRALYPGYGALVHLPCKLDALCLGALLALFVREPFLLARFVPHTRKFRFLLALLIIAAFGMTLNIGPFEGVNLRMTSFAAITLLLFAVLFGTLLLLTLLAPQEWPFRLLAHPILPWLGAVSYFTYLFHQLFSAFLHYALRDSIPLLESRAAAALVTILSLACILTLADLSRRYFEAPILNWGKRQVY